ncbi:MAG: hypothetical protein OEX07_03920 [Gammaproteobacteria bacterium]|nr:hypothetical protein [Gammaproteobacteria bacterium]
MFARWIGSVNAVNSSIIPTMAFFTSPGFFAGNTAGGRGPQDVVCCWCNGGGGGFKPLIII